MQQPYLCTYHTNKNDNYIGQKLYFPYVLLHTAPWHHTTGTNVIFCGTDHFCSVFVRPCVWRHTRYYKRDTPTPVVLDISSWKRAPVDMLAPNNKRGMTYQTDKKHLTMFPEYFVGVVKLACYSLNTRLLLRVFNDNLLKYYKKGQQKNSLKCYFSVVFVPHWLAPYRISIDTMPLGGANGITMVVMFVG